MIVTYAPRLSSCSAIAPNAPPTPMPTFVTIRRYARASTRPAAGSTSAYSAPCTPREAICSPVAHTTARRKPT
jgi:hypothetical protein